MFELTYEPFDVNGAKVSETKRITLDAGQNLDLFQSMYKTQDGGRPLVSAIGLKKVAGEQKEFNSEGGWLIKWEKMDKNAGNQGLAIIVDPKTMAGQAEDKLNLLVLSKAGADGIVSYRAGFIWDRTGAGFNSWKTYVDNIAKGLLSPIEVTVSPADGSAGR
jgi:pectinesterase